MLEVGGIIKNYRDRWRCKGDGGRKEWKGKSSQGGAQRKMKADANRKRDGKQQSKLGSDKGEQVNVKTLLDSEC